jgi:adenosine kinase
MSIVVTGSIAVDHLSTFEGRFADQLVPEALAHVSLSFLVSSLDVRRGGVAANIALGLARLGRHAVLVGAAGSDFADYRAWLDTNGVDTGAVAIHDDLHTARFNGISDAEGNQIASFYPGAMQRAREIELGPIVDPLPDLTLVLVGADDPEAMLRHSAECRDNGYPFAADPSQQMAFMDGAQLRLLVDGAAFLFTNEYERSLLIRKTGWAPADILDRVGVWVTTLGAAGARVDRRGEPGIDVPAVPVTDPADPTGVGDGFRAGFLAGIERGYPLRRCAELGCALASMVLRSLGPQDYPGRPAGHLDRILAVTYGSSAA